MTKILSSLLKILRLVVFVGCVLFSGTSVSAQVWTVVSGDPKGDGVDPSLADVAQLSYRYDKQQDVMWFRVTLYAAPSEAFGVNIALDTGADVVSKMNWWGANQTFTFDKLITAFVTRTDGGYQGTIGVGDVVGIKEKKINNLFQNNLQIQVEGDSILLGVKRTDITDKLQMKLIAAVGSNQKWNDDIPNAGSATIDLATAKPNVGLREIDVSRNNLQFPADYQALSDAKPPRINRNGSGGSTLILIPGMYSGNKSFDGFIARNQSRYQIYLLTPPGISGTPARSMPNANTSFAELTWTRRLERDILDLIHTNKIRNAVIVAERQPGAQAAIELAEDHPDQIAGVVLIATNLVQFFPSPKDPTRKVPVAFPDRVMSVDEFWGAKWFKYVTPETWRSGDLRPQLLSKDSSRAQTAWDELEGVMLEVKIRYLCEFWASDVTRGFDRLRVPVLAIVPGFDEKFLADRANSFAKIAFLDSWETLVPKHPQIEILKIPEARMLVLDDEPTRADEAIAAFVQRLWRANERK